MRIALGAPSLRVAGLVAGRIARAGAAVGLALALASGSFAKSLLFQLAPSDPGRGTTIIVEVPDWKEGSPPVNADEHRFKKQKSYRR